MRSVLGVLLAASVAFGADWPFPVEDDMYVDLASGRHVCSGADGVPGWGTLPVSTPTRIFSVAGSGSEPVVVVTGDGKAYAAVLPANRSGADKDLQSGGYLTAPLAWTQVSGLSASGEVVVDASGTVRGIADANGFQGLQCSFDVSESHVSGSCSKDGSMIAGGFGVVNASASAPGGAVWLATEKAGLVHVSNGEANTIGWVSGNMWSVAVSEDGKMVAAGNETVVALVNATTERMFRWDWVTNVTNGQGGVYDDVATTLAFDSEGTLWVGTPSALNARWVNGSVSRFAGLGAGGLPWGNITALHAGIDTRNGGQRFLLVGTTRGLSIAHFEGSGESYPSSWEYLYGRRWLPGPSISSFAVPGSWNKAGAATVAALAQSGEWGDGCGIAVVERQPWTLAQKAIRMRNIQARHNRHGLVAECILTPAGDISNCTNGPSDNNGLWTSLVALSEVQRYTATGASDALQNARMWYDGMALVNNVTGISGLMARSAIGPSEPRQTGSTWHNSTSMPGWMWKGDTSSDEVCGHAYGWSGAFFGLANVANQSSDALALRREAATYLVRIAKYITENNFTLIDVTGRPTTWGHWDPPSINWNRSWSDERGLNAMQILGLLASAHDAAVFLGEQSTASMFEQAFESLGMVHDYLGNLLNLKIESPTDDNYSDDELSYCAIYPAISSDFVRARPQALAAVRAGLWRLWDFVRPERPDWWNAISVAVLHETTSFQRTMAVEEAQDAIQDALWNLRTWPLELIQWTADNSHRLDIYFRPGVNRDFQTHTDALRVLPANERGQLRWNGSPYSLNGGGAGGSEMDAGAWMAPWGMLVGKGLLKVGEM